MTLCLSLTGRGTIMDLPEEEAWVRECLPEALPRCTVDQHDDNSEAGMYDLTITYPDGTIGAVEVTAAADRQQVADPRWNR